MISVAMTAPGGPEVLRVVTLPNPQITDPHQVLVRLHAAALNPVDYKVRRGGEAGKQVVLGCDGAGVVEAIGDAVTRCVPGDGVYFVNGGYGDEPGTYTQYVVLDESVVAHKPKSLDFIGAAAVPLVLITAWEALYDRVSIHAGSTVLVQAGAGGVGHVAVQLAKLAGARVLATVSTEEKAHFVSSLGAECVNYRTENVLERVRELTDGCGVDVVFDTVGGETFTSSLALLDFYGTVVTCVERGWPDADASLAMERNVTVAWTWMPAPQVFGNMIAREAQTRILERGAALIDAGELHVKVGAVYPLEGAAEAHAALESGRVIGKVVLSI
jgi:NADPH2:quinone reductase